MIGQTSCSTAGTSTVDVRWTVTSTRPGLLSSWDSIDDDGPAAAGVREPRRPLTPLLGASEELECPT